MEPGIYLNWRARPYLTDGLQVKYENQCRRAFSSPAESLGGSFGPFPPRRSPFLKLLQIAAVAGDAKSWWSHRSITDDPDHRGMGVEIHHVFPQNWLKKNGLGGHVELDTLANFAFLSKHDNIKISDGDPASYLKEADTDELRSQWIPLDSALWTVDRFTEFCGERRRLLAGALNELLGLTRAPLSQEPLDADESPEPEVGAWAEDESAVTA